MQEGHYFCQLLLHLVDFCEDSAYVLLLEYVLQLGNALTEDFVGLAAINFEDPHCKLLRSFRQLPPKQSYLLLIA